MAVLKSSCYINDNQLQCWQLSTDNTLIEVMLGDKFICGYGVFSAFKSFFIKASSKNELLSLLQQNLSEILFNYHINILNLDICCGKTKYYRVVVITKSAMSKAMSQLLSNSFCPHVAIDDQQALSSLMYSYGSTNYVWLFVSKLHAIDVLLVKNKQCYWQDKLNLDVADDFVRITGAVKQHYDNEINLTDAISFSSHYIETLAEKILQRVTLLNFGLQGNDLLSLAELYCLGSLS